MKNYNPSQGDATSYGKPEYTSEIITILLKSAIFFVLSFLFLKYILLSGNTTMSLSGLLFAALLFSGIPWGWSLITRVVPLAAGGNLVFVIVFYLIKLIAAYFIGLFVMIWNILKIGFLLFKQISAQQK